jgi:hypothetical protein
MRKFHVRKRHGRRTKGIERKHRRAAALDGSMVLLDDVVEIATAAYLDGPPLSILLS